MNVNNAFTESFFKKKIYMKTFFEVTLASSEIFQIWRNFYELKQIVKNWHEKCVQKFKKLNFEQMFSNSCFFRHLTKKIVFFVYVNDIDINVRFFEQVKWFKKKFDKMFKIKNLKKMKKIFDIRIIRNRKNRLFRMNQIHYLIEILNELSMKVKRYKIINIFMNDYDCIKFFNSFDERINVKNYQHVIEKMMWAAIHTRFDIAFFTERLSQFFSDLTKQHDENLKHLLRYLRSIINLNLMLDDSKSFKVVEYFDFDYVVDKFDRKCILNYVYMLKKTSIAWKSRKQKFVVTFIIETKYMILFFCARKKMWMMQLLKNMKLNKYFESEINVMTIAKNVKHENEFSSRKNETFVQLKDDNQAANNLVHNHHIHERSKHINVAYHHVRNLVRKNLIQLNYIFSFEMIANDMTKLLSKKKFNTFVKQLKMQKWKSSENTALDLTKKQWKLWKNELWSWMTSNENVRKWKH